MKPIKPNSGFKSRNLNYKVLKHFNKKGLIKYVIIIALFFLLIFGWWIQSNIYSDLPDVSEIRNMTFSQSTVILDRNGEELYKLFDQNRQYVPYEEISENMINAIIAMEDQRYRDHKGMDVVGIIRAGIRTSLGDIQGASTIPQQLVMNLLLYRGTNFYEKAIRKLREIVLTRRLDNVLERQIQQEYPGLNKEQLRRKMKELTLELYLNYIFLGNNAYGIEMASQTYFGVPASELGILESAIIASIPKGPSIYEPYRNRSRLMGSFTIQDGQGNTVQASTGFIKEIQEQFKENISKINLRDRMGTNEILRALSSNGSFNINYGGRTFSVKYNNGRKNGALARMFEDGYISSDELKDAVIKGIDYQFRVHRFPIKAPHFVHWITEILEENYDRETLERGGLVIRTSLDLEIQEKAENILKETYNNAKSHGADNKAMIYIDSSNGDVLAYVGSIDYFNQEIQGQNDIIRRRRQLGSAIKPFIYALGFEQLTMSIDTPIFDIPFNIGGDEPNNADGDFMGLVPLKNALAYSRNIPAVKMFFALGGEAIAKPRLKTLGFDSLLDNREYGYPLALGAGEITMLETAQAYSQLSQQGEKVSINPILEIRSSNGSILYEKEIKKEKSIISPGIASLIREILSNSSYMPSGRVGLFSVRNLNLAIKSGTSNVRTSSGNRPRDGRLATYTPNRVAIFRAGNTDARPMNRSAFGATLLSPDMRNFYSRLRDNNLISNESLTPIDTIQVQVSKLTGLPVSDSTPSDLIVNSIGLTQKSFPTNDMGAELIEFDTMCNGPVGPYTPIEYIKQGYIFQAYSFMPNNMDLTDIQLRRERAMKHGTGWIEELPRAEKEKILATTFNFNNIFTSFPTQECEGRIPRTDNRINIEILEPQIGGELARNTAFTFTVSAPKNIREVILMAGDQVLGRNRYNGNRNSVTDMIVFSVPTDIALGDIAISIMAVDVDGFSNQTSQLIKLVGQDNTAPIIQNRRDIINDDGEKEVRLFITDQHSYVVGGTISKSNGEKIKDFEGGIVTFSATAGQYTITAKDYYNNTMTQTITVE